MLFAPVYINEINYTTQQVLLLRNANTKTKDIPVLAVQIKYNFFADVYAGMVHVFNHFRFQARAPVCNCHVLYINDKQMRCAKNFIS